MLQVPQFVRTALGCLDSLKAPPLPFEVPKPQHLHDCRRSCGEQRILVTGGTSGIGLEAVKLLSELGHRVAVPCRSRESREAFRGKGLCEVWQADYDLLDLMPHHTSMPGAHSDPMRGFCEWIETRLGKLDAVVLCAGETGLDWQNLSRRKIWEKVHLWVESHARLLDNAIPLLHDFDQPGNLRGRIIFVSSSMADASLPSVEPYGEIKRETERLLMDVFLSKYPDRRLQNILPVIVRPGSVATRMHEEVLEKGSPELRERTEQLKREGRLYPPDAAGKIIAGIALTGCMFNTDTLCWDQPIRRAQRVSIEQEHYRAMQEHSHGIVGQLPRLLETGSVV